MCRSWTPRCFKVAEQIPLEQKITKQTTKYALRQALEGIVPGHVLHRAKLGFPVPLRHWLRGPELFDWAQQQIADSQTDHLLDKAAITTMLDEHRDGALGSQPPPLDRCWCSWSGTASSSRSGSSREIQEPVYPVRLRRSRP